MVDTDLYAAIYFFDNYLGPFSFAVRHHMAQCSNCSS